MPNKNQRAKLFNTITPSTEEGFSLDTKFGAEIEDGNQKTDSKLDYYFESYSHFGIHEEMLKDEVRTLSYMRAICKNKHLFKDKIVLDVGAGTGVLSMFAAQAGAKHVYAVDMASIVEKSRLIIEENGMSDKITAIRGKIEEIELPVEKVDIIISEWMGYFLLYEGMLDSVIYARDKWLVPNGLIMPDRAVMFIAGIEDEQWLRDKHSFWDNVYGFRMSCAQKANKNEPLVDTLNKEAINTSVCPIFEIDIKTIKVAELNFASSFSLKVNRDDVLNGFVGWFDCFFTDCHLLEKLPTGPYEKYTHWKQTMFYFDQSLEIDRGGNVEGHIAVKKNSKNPRELDIKIWCNTVERGSKNRISRMKYFVMH